MSQGLIKTSKPAANESHIVNVGNNKLLIVKDSWVQQNGLEKIFPRPGNIYWSKTKDIAVNINNNLSVNEEINLINQIKGFSQKHDIPFNTNNKILDLETLHEHGWTAAHLLRPAGLYNSGSGQGVIVPESKDGRKKNETIVSTVIAMSSLLAPKNDTDVACYSPERRLARIFQEALDKQSKDASSRFSPKELLACAQTLINDLLDNDQRDTNNTLLGLAFERCSWSGFKDIANLKEDVIAAAHYCKILSDYISLVDNFAVGTSELGLDYVLGCLLHAQSVDISAMTRMQKITVGIKAAFKKLPRKIGQDLKDQITYENIAMAAAGLFPLKKIIKLPLIVTSIGSGGEALYEMYESTQKMGEAKNQKQLDAATNQMADAMASAGESGLAALFSTKIGKKPSKHGKDLPEEKETKQENPKDQGQKSEEDTNEADSKPDQINQEAIPETPDQKPSNQEEPNPETKNNNQTPDDNNQKENQKDSKESTVEKPKEKPLLNEEAGKFKTKGYSKFLSKFRFKHTRKGSDFLDTLMKERQNVEPEKELDRRKILQDAIEIANSGKEFFKEIDNFSGDLVKIQPPEFSKLTPTTIYFTTEKELSKAAKIARTGGPSIAEQFALPLTSEREEYRVIKITTKPGIKTTIHVSTIAPASQENKRIGKMIKRPGGARQYLVIRRSDFTEKGTIGMLKNNGQYKEGNFK